MDYKQEQEEEREVLLSIYEEDDRFAKIDDTTFQYKFGEDGHFKSFVLEIKWTDEYPEKLPDINLNAFYNKHLNDNVKELVISKLVEQGELNLGCAVTFTLIDWTNEHFDELTEQQTEIAQQHSDLGDCTKEEQTSETISESSKKEKKEKLTKQQKRKLGNRLNAKGELERGWNWVDVVRHLSKTSST